MTSTLLAEGLSGPAGGGPDPTRGGTLRLRPPAGFGDHLMLTAVIEGIRSQYPAMRIEVLAGHPEIYRNNPQVDETIGEKWLKRRDPARLDEYLLVAFRPPAARAMQISGHLIDDMYDRVGLPLDRRPRRPRIYLTERELGYRARFLERLPRPRIAIVPHGKRNVRLPNKIYPPGQWRALVSLMRELPGSLIQVGARNDGPRISPAVDMRDIGYRRTASVLRRCDLVVTHVSGIMHLAAAVGVRAVTLYGAAEHPEISGYPWNRNLYVPIACGPCWMEAPCSHLTCMRELRPEIALREIQASLDEPPLDFCR